jgi:methionyl-tRNA formyltransferase
VIEVVELQPEGKRPMTLKAYRNGHRWDEGFALESAV